MPARRIENPMPFLAEAAEAANLYLNTKREHLKISAEILAKREGKRAALLGSATFSAFLMLSLTFFWITYAIHEAGARSWIVALMCLGFFGAVTGLLVFFAQRAAHPPSNQGQLPKGIAA